MKAEIYKEEKQQVELPEYFCAVGLFGNSVFCSTANGCLIEVDPLTSITNKGRITGVQYRSFHEVSESTYRYHLDTTFMQILEGYGANIPSADRHTAIDWNGKIEGND